MRLDRVLNRWGMGVAAACIISFSWGISLLDAAEPLVPANAFGLRIARGFRISLFADGGQANDIQAMALDSRGNVVVTGPGYIRTLLDMNGDRRADTVKEFANTTSGGQGLCFDGTDLYFIGDGALCRFHDADGDGVADGPPERLLSMDVGPHGMHGIRRGPQGAIYLIGGNDAHATNEHVSLPDSPLKSVEGGALLRLSPASLSCEVLSQGFRNPCDLDFNFLGDVFTADSGEQPDLFLPWYSPSRVLHVAYGGHHGWRLPGQGRGWPRPDYSVETAGAVAVMGPVLPTGLTCYRHYQFPPRYRNGLFLCDWAFGRIYFLPLLPIGSSYQSAPEVFLEPMGVNGFAPSAMAVTADGSLLVATGGRKTPGAIYRIEAVGGNPAFFASNWWLNAISELDATLTAPQPMESWSRAIWVPIALRLGPLPFAEALADQGLMPALRIRAAEILTELHGGLSPQAAGAGAQANSPLVRARVAWSLGQIPPPNFVPVILGLARDPDPMVRRRALESIIERVAGFDNVALQQAIGANLGHPDKRVRQCAARLATLLPDPAWQALWTQSARSAPEARLTTILALLWRTGPSSAVNTPAIESSLAVFAQTRVPDLRLQALRLIIMALGDYRLQNPTVEVQAGYEPGVQMNVREALFTRVCTTVRANFPSGIPIVDQEAARVLAMLEDDDPAVPGRVLGMLTDMSPPTADFHYLVVLSRLTGPMPTNAAEKMAHAIVSLDRKLSGQEQAAKLNWTIRLVEVTRALLQREPKLADALLGEGAFPNPAHLDLAPLLEGGKYLRAARLFWAAVQQNPRWEWSESLLELLSALPDEQAKPLFRQHWAELRLRDAITLKLAPKPQIVDRDKFLAGLLSSQTAVVQASLGALLELPREGTEKALVPGMRLLLRLCQEPKETATRSQLITWLNRESGQAFKVEEQGDDATQLRRAYGPVFAWFAKGHAEAYKSALAEEVEDSRELNAILREVPWERGDSARGQTVFQDRGCQVCHNPSGWGANLGGVTGRYARDSLFHAIAYPSRDISAVHRTTSFQTRAGQTFTGFIVYESPEVVLLQTSGTSSVRLFNADIVWRQPSDVSFMPTGLLTRWKALEYADLYAYLKALGAGR